MKPSDCPYAVGTPEHSDWIKNVLIPHQGRDAEFIEAEEARAGAEAIGGTLIVGEREVDPLARWLQTTLMKKLQESADMMIVTMKQFQSSLDAITKEFEGVGTINVFASEENHKQHQKRIKQTCIPHGEPKGSCRKCARRRK